QPDVPKVDYVAQTDAEPASEPASEPANLVKIDTPENANQQKIGQAPENTTQQFLREDTILLKQGEWQLDVGFSYTIDEKPFTQLTVIQPGNLIAPVSSVLHRRLMVADLAFRYGLTDRLQFFSNLP